MRGFLVGRSHAPHAERLLPDHPAELAPRPIEDLRRPPGPRPRRDHRTRRRGARSGPRFRPPPGLGSAGRVRPARHPALPRRRRARPPARARGRLRRGPGARPPRAGRPGGRPGVARGAARRTRRPRSRGIDRAVEVVLGHAAAGTRITVHGDYDVDGVCSTAILVRVLRALGADVDWYLPSRTEDGYGLAAPTVRRLAERGTRLLLTADCAITAVDEVARGARRRDGRRRDRPPPAARRRRAARRADRPPGAVRLPVPRPVRDGRRVQARGGAAGRGGRRTRPRPTRTSTSSRWRRWPTASRCVGENRRLVRAGLRGARRDAAARPARAHARRAGRPGRARRARDRLPARPAHQRRGPSAPRRRGPRAAAHRATTSARPRSRPSSTRGTSSAATPRPGSCSRPRRRSPRPARRRPTSSPATTGTPASSASSRRGSPSATTGRA